MFLLNKKNILKKVLMPYALEIRTELFFSIINTNKANIELYLC